MNISLFLSSKKKRYIHSESFVQNPCLVYLNLNLMSILELHDARRSHLALSKAPDIWHAATSALHRRRRLVDAPCQYTIYPEPVSRCEITRKTTRVL